MTENTSKDLVIVRIFDAPREMVWKAWTDPDWMKKWWGPKPFTAPVIKVDFRVDGKYLYCMRSPDGQDFWSTGTYREIVPMEKIVCTDSFADEKGNVVPASRYGMQGEFPMELKVTVTFEDLKGKTKMTLRHEGLPGGNMKDQTNEGWSTSLDKLEESLLPNELIVRRVINAPREMVWKAWSEPERIIKWWGPNGFTNTFDEFNFKEGGVWKLTMHGPDGKNYPNNITFDEIKKPERIAYTHNGLESSDLKEFQSIVTFEELGEKTMVTLKAIFASKEECEKQKNVVGAEEGGNQTLSHLAADVEKFVANK